MDGARFANALARLGVSPAAMTWKAGIDILSFGATKNGCMAAEAILVFDRERAAHLAERRMRGGHLLSKSRFLAAQLEAYLADDHWLANARHANAVAARLADGLRTLPGVRLPWPTEANAVFPILPARSRRGVAGGRRRLPSMVAARPAGRGDGRSGRGSGADGDVLRDDGGGASIAFSAWPATCPDPRPRRPLAATSSQPRRNRGRTPVPCREMAQGEAPT